MGDTSDNFKIGNGEYMAGILGSKKILSIDKCLLYSQLSCEVIRTTAYYFLLPYIYKCHLSCTTILTHATLMHQ
jgi:hypothetical protein